MTERHLGWLSRLDRAAEGVLLASHRDTETLTRYLAEAGYAVAQVRLPVHRGAGADTLAGDPAARATSLRQAQAEVARVLGLPETAGRNLDALTDSLRDLGTWWPDHDRVALLLHGAEGLVESDLPGWHTLVEVLAQARQDLHRGGPGDRELLTVAVVAGHGVLAMDSEPDPEDGAGQGP